MSREFRRGLGVWVLFVLVELVVVFGSFDAYDLEELEYGNVSIALLDGTVDDYGTLRTDPGHGEQLMTGAGRRRRTVWSAEPLMLPFFLLLGPTALALKTGTVFLSGLWAWFWYAIARRAAPAAPWWVPAALLALPMPLVQRSAISATSLYAHLGTSLLHGAALALLLLPAARGRRMAVAAAVSGLVAGLGLYQSFSLAPLLPAVAWVAWRLGGRAAGALWALGTGPGLLLAWLFRDTARAGSGVVVALTGLEEGGVFRGGGLPHLLQNLATAGIWGPGFGRVVDGRFTYLPLGWIYSVLLAGFVLWAWTVRRGRPVSRDVPRVVGFGVTGSFAMYLVALAATGFKLETGFFDGLRYLLPVAPGAALLGTWTAGVLGRPRAVAGPLLAAHVLGLALAVQPSVVPAPWARLKGFEPWVMRQHLQGDLVPAAIAPTRRGRWALFAGTSDGWRAEAADGWAGAAARHGLSGDAADEYWRGFGVGLLLRAGGEPGPLPDVLGVPRARVLEGRAMGYAFAGCQETVRRWLQASDPDASAELWYGFGRAEPYCGQLAVVGHDHEAHLRRGIRDAWRRDYAADPADAATDEFILALPLY